MARGIFKCAECGEAVYFNVGKNRRDTDRYAEWLESQDRLCSDCEEKQRTAANAEAAAKNAASGLPALTGTDKQIAWAETIRANKLEVIRMARAGELQKMYLEAYWGTVRGIAYDDYAMEINDPFVDYACSLLTAQTSASWWIDSRDARVGFILKDLFVKHPPVNDELEQIPEAKAEALAEATIRPESPLTETVAEIRARENSVEIVFPEKREDFWKLVKKQLGYDWSGSTWKRVLSDTNGTPADRAAEAGNRFLAAGFIIRIFDPAIREAAVNASFEQECTRWIFARTKGEYTGWFAVNWKGRDERLFSAARRLKGSKYDKPSVVVPPEQFDEVLDFAGMYEFRLTAMAQELVECTRRLRDSALTATPITPEDHLPPVPGEKPPKLVVPENIEVADEFKD